MKDWKEKKFKNTKIKTALVVLFSILLVVFFWYLLSLITSSSVILPSPFVTFSSLIKTLSFKTFASDVFATVRRSFVSFVIVCVFGAVLGTFAGLNKNIELFFRPLLTLLKATPVVSIILLAFIWFKTGQVPVFSAFIMSFPLMFIQTVDKAHNLDASLVQMCSVFQIKGIKKLLNFTIPSLVPAYITGARQSLSLIWKVVIASEVLTVPQTGIGRGMQYAQIHLDTAQVFSWTLVAVFLSLTGDLLFDVLLKMLLKKRYTNAS